MPRSSKKSVAKKTTKKTTAKAAKKTVAKKATKRTAKKSTKKTARQATSADRVLVCAQGEQCFWLTDGTVLKDLRELAAAFENMQRAVFLHHVSGERNDFAEWVEHVLQDASCAQKLRRSKTARGAYGVVIRELRLY